KVSLKDCLSNDWDVERMSKVPYVNVVGSLMYLMVCTRQDIAYAISIVSRYLANLDYAKDPDKGRSITEYVFMVHGCVVSWKATLQHVVALSTIEAEYMALTEAVKESIWLKGLLIEQGVNLREIMESKEIKVANIGTKDNAADVFAKNTYSRRGYSGMGQSNSRAGYYTRGGVRGNSQQEAYGGRGSYAGNGGGRANSQRYDQHYVGYGGADRGHVGGYDGQERGYHPCDGGRGNNNQYSKQYGGRGGDRQMYWDPRQNVDQGFGRRIESQALTQTLTNRVAVKIVLCSLVWMLTTLLASNTSSPSIAAVVGSINWPAATRYAARVSPQSHRQDEIVNFGSVCLDLINTYEKENGVKPNKIVVFRDGVSDGQFNMVLNKEMVDMKKAIYTEQYRPWVTFVVAQKRHTTRLFLNNGRDVGNVPPGTVVDTTIVHPFEFDFYLCSHHGGFGTSKPTHTM
nr:protein argonaute 2-like [Tanacetum cinerariifolium]GEX98295.1 protein argonaute 2-like [Tanacetum cinerariifolium]